MQRLHQIVGDAVYAVVDCRAGPQTRWIRASVPMSSAKSDIFCMCERRDAIYALDASERDMEVLATFAPRVVRVSSGELFCEAFEFLISRDPQDLELRGVVPSLVTEDGLVFLGGKGCSASFPGPVLNCAAGQVEGGDLRLYLDDSVAQDISGVLDEAVAWMETRVAQKTRLLVHCVQGISRSAAVVVAYLIKTRCVSVEDALALIRLGRPIAKPNEGFMRQLEQYQKRFA